MGLFYEDFIVGKAWQTRGRTVGESDIINFAGMTGDFTSIHVDENLSKQGPFGGRIAHGTLGMSMALGLMAQLDLFNGTVVALLNLNWDFADVVRIGDTLYARVSVLDKRATSKPERGIVRLQVDLINQADKLVQRGVSTVLVYCRAE